MDVEGRAELVDGELWLHQDDLDPGLNSDEIAFLATLPEFAIIEAAGYNILLSHYIFPNLSGFNRKFYTLEKEFGAHFEFMSKQGCSLGFTGHGHPRGFYQVTAGRFKHFSSRTLSLDEQPSIIGVPPVTRHQQRRGFCIFDSETRTVRVSK
jgi:hypothetical protein